MEAGVVLDERGEAIYWHLPPGRSAGALPDSRTLWEVLWGNRQRLGGVAHTHPWRGRAAPSSIDLSTFAAVEAGLGRRLQWLIVTFSEVATFEWVGPGRLDYGPSTAVVRMSDDDIERLRALSRPGGPGGASGEEDDHDPEPRA